MLATITTPHLLAVLTRAHRARRARRACCRAGWAVSPRNYVLAGSHIFNVLAQCNQLRRVLEYKLENGGEEAKAEVARPRPATGAPAHSPC